MECKSFWTEVGGTYEIHILRCSGHKMSISFTLQFMFKIFYTLINIYDVIPQKQIQTQVGLKVVAITIVQSKWKFWWLDKFSLSSPLSNSIKKDSSGPQVVTSVRTSTADNFQHPHSAVKMAGMKWVRGSAQNQDNILYTQDIYSFSSYLKHCKNVTQSVLDWYPLNPLNMFVQAPCTWKWFFKICLLHMPTHHFWSWKPSHAF